ncbi:MAG: RND family transporter, partial [Candidatus Ornithospirochaeta sp.]
YTLTGSGEIECDYIISRDYRTGLNASVDPVIVEEEKDYPYTSTMYVLVSFPDIWKSEYLSTLENCIDEIERRRDSARPQSIFDWMTISGDDAHLGVISMNPNEDGVWSQEDALEMKNRVENDPMVKYMLIGDSGNSILLQFIYSDFSSSEQMESLSAVFQPLRDMGGRVVLMSNMVIAQEVMKSLSKDLILLASLALVIIFAVYYFSFHSLRLAITTASVSVIAVIWTLGTMKIQGMDLNLMNILTPCMVITLGGTYAMHTISQYMTLISKGECVSGFGAVKRVLKTIIIGAVTTIAGFISLALSPEEGIGYFGISVSIGVVFCALLSTTYLPSLLSLLPPPREKSVRKVKEGLLQRCMKRLGKFTVTHWVLMLVIFLVLAAGFAFSQDKIEVNSDYMSYFPEGDPFGDDCRYFASEIGGTTPFTVKIEAPEGSDQFFLDMNNLKRVKNWEDSVKESEHVLQVISFPSYVAFANREITGEWDIPSDPGLGRIMRTILISYAQDIGELRDVVSKDFNTLTLTIQAWDGINEDLSSVESTRSLYQTMIDNLSLLPDGVKVTISGYPVISMKFSDRMVEGQNTSTLWAVVAVFIISSLVFLSPLKGFLVLIPVFSGIAFNVIFMYLMNIPYDIITISFSSIAVGAGVDDAIHFSLRYIKYRKKHTQKGVRKALCHTITSTGRPIFLTTLSVVLGMSVLGFASYTPIRYFGLLMAV